MCLCTMLGTREQAVVATKNLTLGRQKLLAPALLVLQDLGHEVHAATDFTLHRQPPPGDASLCRRRLVGHSKTHGPDRLCIDKHRYVHTLLTPGFDFHIA